MTTPSNAPDPNCPVCQGIGWYYAPIHNDGFAPGLDMQPCPLCNPVEPISRAGCALVVALFALLVAFLAWGAR